jgi:hypothetical protein
MKASEKAKTKKTPKHAKYIDFFCLFRQTQPLTWQETWSNQKTTTARQTANLASKPQGSQ